jgi:hypothetical protein
MVQIPAIEIAAETLAEKDAVSAQCKAASGESPFSALLKDVKGESSGKTPAKEAGKKEQEYADQQALLNTWMLCLAGPVIHRQQGTGTVSLGGDGTGALCEALDPEEVTGTGDLSRNVLGPGKPGEAPGQALPGEEAEGFVETMEEQSGNTTTKESLCQAVGSSKPSGVASVPGPGHRIEKPEGLGKKQGSSRTEAATRADAETAEQNATGANTKVRETKTAWNRSFWPDRERGAPNEKTGGVKAGTAQYGTGIEDLRPDPISETQQAFRSRVEQQQSANEAYTDIVSQVAEKMKIMLGERKSEIRIQLKPENLGELKIRLTVTDGVLSGRIVVQSEETKGLIQASIPRLQESLEQQGIPVSRFNVNVGGDGGYGRQQFFRDGQHFYQGRQGIQPYRQEEKEEYMLWRGEGTIELLA